MLRQEELLRNDMNLLILDKNKTENDLNSKIEMQKSHFEK